MKKEIKLRLYALTPETVLWNQKATRSRSVKSIYESLGGTSADKLAQRGNSRPDGKSLLRIFKILIGKKEDSYLFIAVSGPGETNATGLIVPKFVGKAENHVAVSMSWRSVNELMIMTKVHYEAWLAAKYMSEFPGRNKN